MGYHLRYSFTDNRVIFYWRGKKAQNKPNRILGNIEFDTKEIKNDVIPAMSKVINTLIEPENLKKLVKDSSSLERNQIENILNDWNKIAESYVGFVVYLVMAVSWVKLFGEMLLKISNNELKMDTKFNGSIKTIMDVFDHLKISISSHVEIENFIMSSGLNETYKNNAILKNYIEDHYKINR